MWNNSDFKRVTLSFDIQLKIQSSDKINLNTILYNSKVNHETQI